MGIKFIIKNLHAWADGKKLLKGVSLSANNGEIHAVMGPNGSGKSTLSKVVMGHPAYKITRGRILIKSGGRSYKNILNLDPDQRAKSGLFLAFQQPVEVPGVNMFHYLRLIYSNRTGKQVSVEDFEDIINPILEKLKIKKSFLNRSLNDGFSGGEKKKSEIVQLALLKPKVVILDEIDSGLDIDSLKLTANYINRLKNPDSVFIVITHYNRILKYIKPNFVHIMIDGRIVKSGDRSLALQVDRKGYR